MASDGGPRGEGAPSGGRDADQEESARLAEIMEVILGIARQDPARRAWVGSGEHVLDGIATGVNMLAEEVGNQLRTEGQLRARMVQAERLAAIGTLAAGVAHEINNPLGFLLANFTALDDRLVTLRALLPSPGAPGPGPGQAAGAGGLLDEIAEISRVGQAGLDRISTIVRGLGNFARIEPEAIEAVRLHEVAEQALALARQEVQFRARLVRRLEPTPPIMGDRGRLTQLLTTLLLNAARAVEGSDPEGTEPDRQEVELATGVDGGRVVARVRDSGRAIPPELRGRVFDPFFSARPRELGGGLGLSIAADVARQHGGELRLEAGAGPGSTFELSLPLDTGLVATVFRPPPSPVAAARRARILVIDDEEQLLRSYKRMLPATYEVEVALGGQAALVRLAADARWDLVVCDLLMPGVDGPAVWQWARQNAPALAGRFLFCTGGAFTERAAAFVEELRGRLLQKPVRRDRLVGAIEAALVELGPHPR